MKKFFTAIVCCILIIATTPATYALELPKLNIDWGGVIKLPDGFWDNWFNNHPIETPDDIELPSEEDTDEVILEAPVISKAKYVHTVKYFGQYKHLEISWNEVKNAESYEVKITKADGTIINYTVKTNSLYKKNIECPKVRIDGTWTSASVSVRAVAGDTYSRWSNSKIIGCDKLHNS